MEAQNTLRKYEGSHNYVFIFKIETAAYVNKCLSESNYGFIQNVRTAYNATLSFKHQGKTIKIPNGGKMG